MITNLAREKYLSEADRYRLLVSKEERTLLYISIIRFFTFTGGFLVIWLGFSASQITGILFIPLVTGMFLYLLRLYSDHSEMKEFFGNLALINQREADAVSGDLSSFESGNSYTDVNHDFSNDVDLFGNSSLFQYLNRTVSGYGRDILAGWLSDPFIIAEDLTSRQDAIRELALKTKWRHDFMASGMKRSLEKSDIAGILGWLVETTFILSSPFKKFLIYFLPVASLGTLSLTAAGIIHYSVFTFIFLVNLLFVTLGLRKTNEIHGIFSRKYYYLTSVKKLLTVFDNETFSTKILNDIRLNISGSNISAAVSVKRLSRIIQAFDSRLNIIVGFILNGILLWDYQCIHRLEKWKDENKNMFPVWLEMLGQIDAFVSLGNYAFNNPGFIYPVRSDNNIVLSATCLGHQLIDENKRVCNDFILEKPGMICIISGANMAGKSTFLRTVAVNYILAMTGAPVCAAEMSFMPLNLFTSMRTTDSLSNSESYFYAELKRLKMLKSRIEEGEPVFFILDEILKGTNSADKSLGSKLFLKKMVELHATGLIATHDTSLGEMEKDLEGVIINKCFEIEIDGEFIKFDYKLQNGITHKMNASFLMKQMGILE